MLGKHSFVIKKEENGVEYVCLSYNAETKNLSKIPPIPTKTATEDSCLPTQVRPFAQLKVKCSQQTRLWGPNALKLMQQTLNFL